MLKCGFEYSRCLQETGTLLPRGTGPPLHHHHRQGQARGGSQGGVRGSFISADREQQFDRGAEILNIFTVYFSGRATDSALALAPLMHEFKWAPDDFDKLAAGGQKN